MLETSEMITADADRSAAVVLVHSFRLDQPADRIRSARLRATAHGVYEARINGRPVSAEVLAPGWSAYEWRLPVSDDPVRHLLAEENTVEVLLGNGWWRGDLGFEDMNLNYGSELGFVAEIEVVYHDGHTQTVTTGQHWQARTSDTVANNLYGGQCIDARLRGTRDTLPVRRIDVDRARFVPRDSPAVIRHETLKPTRISLAPSGATLVDFGQNLVGWVRMRARGQAGTQIVLRHAEALSDGELATRPLRSAKATDTFVLSGGEDEFEPTLTFHGFRYVEVTGYPGELTADQLEAVVVHSDLRRTGRFSCSSQLVTRLVENSVWSQKGNFLSLPTDCPQRDERLGWTGDIAVYAPTACFQFDVADFLHGWLLDLEAETRHNERSAVPAVVPDILKLTPSIEDDAPLRSGPTAVWGDAAVWVPEALWQAYGDRDRLAAHYPGMVLHLESVVAALSDTGLWDQGFQWGDWLDPDARPDEPGAAKADSGVVATACLIRSAAFAARAADVLGHTEDSRRWADLADRTRAAFLEHYVDPDGRVRSDCATVYALAICFGILDGDRRRAAGERLAEIVRERGHRVTTGFAGTPYVTWALSETGHVEDAYRLLLQTDCPSWLYPVTMGATTIWERWDSMLPDGTVNPGEMTSFNHYALGSVADWLYRVVAGIRPAEPGYARIELAPTPGPGLEWARAALDTPNGTVECGWERRGDRIHVRAAVPDGIEAEVILADGTKHVVGTGPHEFTYLEER
ncbi:family 78 glycoside hydrolase catalytic domain [Kitasatospora sp. YST-16]|uniref:alpha-L-rhamnosidase n=1 Tax=Kitasatospora sp. YST-16 TaxID=2998080 RepID=UPI002284C503|nr:alpha-L-rhamnosidase [Kitasatospora sp. YST-16]WAL74673.1 family 78 glycoside hydrolase catalytic domain [Kitasatospora sp. YST-16]WNW40728.1 family 78 glycoside hydrolase catalytic domain [Streptomyces sp. Li-HN-5-13]